MDSNHSQPGSPLPIGLLVIMALLLAVFSRLINYPQFPKAYLCKGSYFALSGRAPFRHLVYPAPESAGLGVHMTLDLGG